MNREKLLKNMTDQVKEAQLKLDMQKRPFVSTIRWIP